MTRAVSAQMQPQRRCTHCSPVSAPRARSIPAQGNPGSRLVWNALVCNEPPRRGLKRVLKKSFCLRARLQPCRKCSVCNGASAPEVRFLFRKALFPQPVQPCRKCFVRNAALAAEVRSLLREALFQHPLNLCASRPPPLHQPAHPCKLRLTPNKEVGTS